jgi:hypothetical protein
MMVNTERPDLTPPQPEPAGRRNKVTGVLGLLGLILVLGVAGGAYLVNRARTPDDALPGPLGSLKQHFAQKSLAPRTMLVRIINVSEAKQQARFWLRETGERPIYVLWCYSPAAAQTVLLRMRKASAATPMAARGDLVIYFPEWPAGDPLAERVLAAFESWPGA